MPGKIKRVYSQNGTSTAFKLSVANAPKDKAADEQQSDVVYRYPCKGCDKVYIGKTKRALGDRIKARTTYNLSTLAEHSKITGRELDTGNVRVLCRKNKLISRKISPGG